MMRTADFLNASRLIQDSVFSCAVDSFLETSFVVLPRFIGNRERKSEFYIKSEQFEFRQKLKKK